MSVGMYEAFQKPFFKKLFCLVVKMKMYTATLFTKFILKKNVCCNCFILISDSSFILHLRWWCLHSSFPLLHHFPPPTTRPTVPSKDTENFWADMRSYVRNHLPHFHSCLCIYSIIFLLTYNVKASRLCFVLVNYVERSGENVKYVN